MEHEGFRGGRYIVLSHLSIKRCHAGGVDDAASVSVCVWLVLRHLADSKADHVKSSRNVHLQKTRSGGSRSVHAFFFYCQPISR